MIGDTDLKHTPKRENTFLKASFLSWFLGSNEVCRFIGITNITFRQYISSFPIVKYSWINTPNMLEITHNKLLLKLTNIRRDTAVASNKEEKHIAENNIT